MKTYGVIVADNGSPWFISGVPDERWNNDMLQQLGNVHGSDFEAVDETGLMLDGNSGQASGAAPAPPPPPDAPTGRISPLSSAQIPNPPLTTSTSEGAPSTTSDPVTTTSAPISSEIAARQPDVTVRARDGASRGAWPWIAAALVVVVGCCVAGYRLRRS